MGIDENNFYTTCHYLSNLLEYMNGQIYFASKIINKHILHIEDEQLITFFIAAVNLDNEKTIIKYFDFIKSKLKDEAPNNIMPYYEFSDGYLYDNDFDSNDFCLAMSNVTNKIIIAYERIFNDDYDDFQTNAIKSLNAYLKKYDKANKKMSCFEFLEIIFAKILKKNLTNEVSFTISTL